jgi:hypothetical protein
VHVILVQVEFLGNLRVREVESHEVQTQHPSPKWLMMASKDRVRQIVAASLTQLAQIALTLGLSVVSPLFGDLRALTAWTPHPVGPTQVPNGLKTFGVVDERLHVYHGTQYRPWRQLKQVLEPRWPAK